MAKVGFSRTPERVLKSPEWQAATDEDDQAMAIAAAVIDDYGELTVMETVQFRKTRTIHRDHTAYQAALAALRIARLENQKEG